MRLILGCANFGNSYGKQLEKDECHRILDRAKELGIWALDTAPSYGNSEAIIKDWMDWGRVLPVFSKATSKIRNTIGDWILLHDENEDSVGYDGVSYYSTSKVRRLDGWIQAPFNHLNYEFKAIADRDNFIARSIFCGGRLQRSHPEDMARMVFGFLKSHEVKNAVFGVESVEELELIVRVANEK